MNCTWLCTVVVWWLHDSLSTLYLTYRCHGICPSSERLCFGWRNVKNVPWPGVWLFAFGHGGLWSCSGHPGGLLLHGMVQIVWQDFCLSGCTVCLTFAISRLSASPLSLSLLLWHPPNFPTPPVIIPTLGDHSLFVILLPFPLLLLWIMVSLQLGVSLHLFRLGGAL